ncbi:hypothetical protein QTP88_010884 [Uroleucon formosanum]
MNFPMRHNSKLCVYALMKAADNPVSISVGISTTLFTCISLNLELYVFKPTSTTTNENAATTGFLNLVSICHKNPGITQYLSSIYTEKKIFYIMNKWQSLMILIDPMYFFTIPIKYCLLMDNNDD